jgi:hypothetical protein
MIVAAGFPPRRIAEVIACVDPAQTLVCGYNILGLIIAAQRLDREIQTLRDIHHG